MTAASIPDFREAARRRLPHFLFEYIDGGSYAEVKLRRNIADLADIALRQRVLRDISGIDLSTTLFGAQQDLPVVLAPVGLARPHWVLDVGMGGRPHHLGNVVPMLKGKTGLSADKGDPWRRQHATGPWSGHRPPIDRDNRSEPRGVAHQTDRRIGDFVQPEQRTAPPGSSDQAGGLMIDSAP